MKVKIISKAILLMLCIGVFATFSISTVSAASLLEKVSNLKESSATESTITLEWSKVLGANGYQIYRSSSKNGVYERKAIIKNGNTVSYKDNGLAIGKTYYYKIRAYKKLNKKTYYGAYSLVFSAVTKPGSITNIDFTVTFNSSVILSWSPVPGATKYNIYYSNSDNGTYTLDGSSTSTSYEFTSFKSDPYYFKVAAVKAAGLYDAIGSYSRIISCSDIPSMSSMNISADLYKKDYEFPVYTIYNSDDVNNTVISTITDKINNNDFLLDDNLNNCLFLIPDNTDSSMFQKLDEEYSAQFGSDVTLNNYGEYAANYERSISEIFNVDYDAFFFKKAIAIQFVVITSCSPDLIFVYFYTKGSGNEYEQAEAKAKEVAGTFTGSMYDKVKASYDYLVNNVTYDYAEINSVGTNTRAHSAYGALIENLCVCDGYAEAFYLLMESCDIPCNLVVNKNHCWNEVMIDNKWYMIDLTSRDFLFGEDMMKATNELTFVDNGITYIWETDTVSFYGYGTSGNSSNVKLAEESYLDMQIKLHYSISSYSLFKMAS